MPEDNVQKILICGDVKGRIKSLFNRISKILKLTGDFDMLFCIGDFFGSKNEEFEELISGQLNAMLPIFIVCPLTETAQKYLGNGDGCDLCQKVTYLGSRGVYTTVTGLRIVYFGDRETDSETAKLPSGLLLDAITAEDYGFMGIDLLLTSQWPHGVEKYMHNDLPDKIQNTLEESSTSISKLAYFTRPRYHFSSGNGVYFERSPYRNHRILKDKAHHTTRFIALADVKNSCNEKYIYALKLTPIDKMAREDLITQPPDVTENPYRECIEKAEVPDKEVEVQTDQYFYNLNRENKYSKQRKRRNTNFDDNMDDTKFKKVVKNGESFQEKLNKSRDQAACWFCLGNPEVKKHLIVSIGTQAYLAMPRGPLVPEHVLILTIGHHQNWISCPDYVRKEIEEYKVRLKRMFAAQGKTMVMFERNLRTQHYQLQVVPVPFSVAADVKQVFLDMSMNCEDSPCNLKPIPRKTEIDEICALGIPYFYVELPTGEKLFGKISKNRISNVNIQFGRVVLTDPKVLNCPEKADWRECTEDEERETELTTQLRQLFAPYEGD